MTRKYVSWTGERIARLAFLMGKGWDAKRVASDPTVDSNFHNIHRQASRFGLAFGDARVSVVPLQSQGVFDTAARHRGITREALIKLLLICIAKEPNLIDNILDDDE